MKKEEKAHRFGPEHWVTLRETGEHVQVEAWSAIATAYRVRSRKRGVFLVPDADLDDMLSHPEADRGRDWSRCPVMGCGAPLTPELVICGRCHAPTCTCGRCRCPSGRAPLTRAKKVSKKIPVGTA